MSSISLGVLVKSMMNETNDQEIADTLARQSSFEPIVAPVRRYLANLDSYLHEQVSVLEPEVQEQVSYVLSHSGKRLRPILVAYSGWHEGFENNEALIRLGAILELVHLATLVHDDILDEASLRHGSPTVAAKYGKDAAVLVGDVLFAHALCLASEYDTTEICRSVALATSRVCSGEISQTYAKRALNFDRKHYYRVIELKTAELFAVACRLGAMVGGKSEAESEALAKYGMHLGCAYQIFDDVVDLFASESEIGKTLGTDLANGKFTLPLLILLESMEEIDRNEWIDSYQRGDADEAVKQLESKLSEYPILERVRAEFDSALNQAEPTLLNVSEVDAQHFQTLLAFVRNLFSKVEQ